MNSLETALQTADTANCLAPTQHSFVAREPQLRCQPAATNPWLDPGESSGVAIDLRRPLSAGYIGSEALPFARSRALEAPSPSGRNPWARPANRRYDRWSPLPDRSTTPLFHCTRSLLLAADPVFDYRCVEVHTSGSSSGAAHHQGRQTWFLEGKTKHGEAFSRGG